MASERIRNKELHEKVVPPETAAEMVTDGMTIATSGYRHEAFPRAFFKALADRAEKGLVKNINLWSACLLGHGVEGVLAQAGALTRRLGSHGDSSLRKVINTNQVACNDIRSEMLSQMIRSGQLGQLDLAVVDAVAITESGGIVPTHGMADIAGHVRAAKKVVVEIDHGLPMALEGLHDVYLPPAPPGKAAIPLTELTDRIGTTYIPLEKEKIACIIECEEPYRETGAPASSDEKSLKVAKHLVSFLKAEVEKGRLPNNLTPIECGIGAIPGSVLKGLAGEGFSGLEFFTPGITPEMVDLIAMGKAKIANASGLRLSVGRLKKFCNEIDKYRDKIILRPLEIINNPEMVHRFGILAINGAIEADIYGHINCSHIGGTSLLNGVGGSGVFAANGYLSVFTFFSTGKGGNISTIVPMAPHVDHSEHNVDVIVTEQGLADLRGLSPVERACEIINNCAHPDYRPMLVDYLERAKRRVGGHEPHLLEEAFVFHRRYGQTGSMKTG